MRQFPRPLLLAAVIAALSLNACSDKPAFPVRSYPMGDRVTLGHIIYTVFETQWLTQIPQDPTPRIPQHRFFLVRLSAVNSSASDVVIPNLTIQDDHGKTYEELSNGEGVPQWIGFLRHAKPADSVQGYIVFDSPPAHYKLRVTDETDERAALIDIPLSFGAETPDVPIPGVPKQEK
jgi:hypothetical protein